MAPSGCVNSSINPSTTCLPHARLDNSNSGDKANCTFCRHREQLRLPPPSPQLSANCNATLEHFPRRSVRKRSRWGWGVEKSAESQHQQQAFAEISGRGGGPCRTKGEPSTDIRRMYPVNSVQKTENLEKSGLLRWHDIFRTSGPDQNSCGCIRFFFTLG